MLKTFCDMSTMGLCVVFLHGETHEQVFYQQPWISQAR